MQKVNRAFLFWNRRRTGSSSTQPRRIGTTRARLCANLSDNADIRPRAQNPRKNTVYVTKRPAVPSSRRKANPQISQWTVSWGIPRSIPIPGQLPAKNRVPSCDFSTTRGISGETDKSANFRVVPLWDSSRILRAKGKPAGSVRAAGPSTFAKCNSAV